MKRETPTHQEGVQGPREQTQSQDSTTAGDLSPGQKVILGATVAYAFQVGPQSWHRRQFLHAVAEFITLRIDKDGTPLSEIFEAAEREGISRAQVVRAIDKQLSGPESVIYLGVYRPRDDARRVAELLSDQGQFVVRLTRWGSLARRYLARGVSL